MENIDRLDESEQEFLMGIVNSLPLAVFCKDYTTLPGKFVAWNKAAERMWGLDSSEVIGKSDYDFFPKPQADYFQTKDLETLCSTDVQLIPEELVDSPTVGRRFVRTWKVAVPANDKTPRFLLGMSLDVSEEKKLEESVILERQKALIAAKLASLGEMAGGIVHEINNPLATILGQTELLKKLLPEHIAEHQKLITAVERIQSSVGKISKTVEGLMKFARDGAPKPFRDASANEILKETIALCGQQIRNHDIELVIDWLEPDATIQCRDVDVSQVIMNLMNNARSAVSRTPGAWIRVSIRDIGDELEYSITDSGNRPPKEIAKRLFTPFFTTKPIGQGTGLGLSICQGVVVNHGGRIWLDTESERTRFTFRIPKSRTALKLAA